LTEFDFSGILLPVLLSISASIALFAITRYSKTSEGTLTGTVKIAHVELTMAELERRIDERLERLENLIKEGERERRDVMARIYERIEKLEAKILLHDYRLNQVDSDNGQSSERNVRGDNERR
jgi:hypothetical protein